MGRYGVSETVRTCDSCGELRSMDARARYCSPACRQAAYRRRLQHAQKRGSSSLCQNVTDECRTLRHADESPALGHDKAALRNALVSLTRNAEMLDKLAEALLPSLLARSTSCHEPWRGAALGTIPEGERTTGTPGGRPGQETNREHSPGFLVQESTAMVDAFDVGRFYRDVIWALGEHAIRGGTGFGAAAIVKRVAKEHGLQGTDDVPLPRPTREERLNLAWSKKNGGAS